MKINNPYKNVIQWLEQEIHKNGILKIEKKSNGKLSGFTVSSQHTQGNDSNILQLVNTMKQLSKNNKKYNWNEKMIKVAIKEGFLTI
jgi:hypothetical protein